MPDPILEILLPVHNEGAGIERTVREIYGELSPRLAVRFLISEDGSRDNTKEVLRRLSAELPMKLLMSDARKGYSRAVRDGMAEVTAPYLLCLDSDGQCDPKDFWRFWDARESAALVMGWRVRRADNALRAAMSRTFYYAYRMLYRVPVHDPSCPFLLMKRSVVERIAPEMGEMQEGFWWEFVARVFRRRLSILELPVNHRLRTAGKTQVYRLSQLPRIGYRHFVALFRIWSQTRRPGPNAAI